MDDDTLRHRLDAALLLLFANFLLVLALALRFATGLAVGSLMIVALIAYGHYRSG